MALIYWVLSIIVYYALHSVLVLESVKTLLSRYLLDRRYYRIVYNLLSILLLLPIFWYYFKVESIMLFQLVILKYLGVGMMMLGSYLLIKSLLQYDLSEFSGVQYLEEKSNRNSQHLNTSGLNAIVRHPLYFASLIIFWGLFFYLPNTKILSLAVVTNLYLLVGIRLEEQKLEKEFGAAYRKYQKEVPMLLPGINRPFVKRDA